MECNNTLPPTPIATSPPTTLVNSEASSSNGVGANVVVGVVVGVTIVALVSLIALIFMCQREKQGRPVFQPQVDHVNPTFEPSVGTAVTDIDGITQQSTV